MYVRTSTSSPAGGVRGGVRGAQRVGVWWRGGGGGGGGGAGDNIEDS